MDACFLIHRIFCNLLINNISVHQNIRLGGEIGLVSRITRKIINLINTIKFEANRINYKSNLYLANLVVLHNREIRERERETSQAAKIRISMVDDVPTSTNAEIVKKHRFASIGAAG